MKLEKNFLKMQQGYKKFREKYAHGNKSIMKTLSHAGQKPQIMVVACCDSRVDPALILQCDPGDLFVVRNVANIVPPFEKDEAHHGTSAALEFGIRFLKIKHLVLFGHSQCGGIRALLNKSDTKNSDFIQNWVSLIDSDKIHNHSVDKYAKLALKQSFKNCLTFPWIKEKVSKQELNIHLWFFNIKKGLIYKYSDDKDTYTPL